MTVAPTIGIGRSWLVASNDLALHNAEVFPAAAPQRNEPVRRASQTHATQYAHPSTTPHDPKSPRGGNTRHKTVWDSARGVVDDISNALPNIGAVVGIAGLVSLIPVARKSPGIAEAVADTARVISSKSVRPEAGAVKSAFQAIQRGRVAFGQTGVGAALLRVQQPLAVVGLALNGAMLVRDVNRYREGKAGLRPIILDSIGLVPAIASGVKSLAGLMAAQKEVSAASTAAKALGKVESTAVDALDTAVPHLDEANAVRQQLTETADISRAGKTIANDTLEGAIRRRGFSGFTAKPEVLAAQPVTKTAERVDRLKGQLQAVEDRASSALRSTHPNIAQHNNLHDRVQSAVTTARDAKTAVSVLERDSAQLATTARTAEKVEFIGGNATTGVRVANSSVSLGQSMSLDNAHDVHRNTFDIAVTGGILALGLTGRPAK